MENQQIDHDIDTIIDKLLRIKGSETDANVKLSADEVQYVVATSTKYLLEDASLLELQSPINVVGCIRSDYQNLLNIFKLGGFPPDSKYLFLGNYTSSKKQGIECMTLLLAYKIKYPSHVFLIRGRYESMTVTQNNGFVVEGEEKYDISLRDKYHHRRILKTLINPIKFGETFDCIPAAAVIDKKTFGVSSGLSPWTETLDKISAIERPGDLISQTPMWDLGHTEPRDDIEGWQNLGGNKDLNVFGQDVTSKFFKNNGLNLIIRSGQVNQEGYEYRHDKKVLHIHSVSIRIFLDTKGAFVTIKDEDNHSIIKGP